MTIVKHEIKEGRTALVIWTAAVASLLAVCGLFFTEMVGDMGDVSEIFAEMGSFSAAFGMDKINFGEFIGFFGVECGNVLGLGGAFFAALIGVSSLAKEEKEHTAEFLLTHPLTRKRVVAEKLAAVLLQIVVFNAFVIGITALSVALIGESLDFGKMSLLFLAYFLMQLEIAAICFGISAFVRRGSLGIGLGIAAVCYFLNIIANLTDQAKFLKYITPFGYTDGADIIEDGSLNSAYLAAGAVFCIIGVAAAFYKYCRKDIM